MYRPGGEIGNADGLSRLPLPNFPMDVPIPGETILLMGNLELSQINAKRISQWTSHDPLLSRIHRFLLLGWPQLKDEETLRFRRRKDELSVQDGCVLWGTRVVIPKKGQELVLELFHEAHPGISRMKSLARSFVWWPGMDQQLETRVKSCEPSQLSRYSPSKVPLHPWEWPDRPWSRIHIDFAGPFMGKMFLIVVDAHSKWMEVSIVQSATSNSTLEKLRALFATHGLPEVIVSDNGTAFTSTEFQEFVRRNGIRHIRTAPYHPSSNGQVERAVQTFKDSMKRTSTESLETRVSRFLFHYHITPHSTTGITPAQLLMGRELRSHFSRLIPGLSARVGNKQQLQKEGYDCSAKEREIKIGSRVFVRNFPSGTSWLKGTLTEKNGPLSFIVKLDDGRILHRHIDHIRVDEANSPDGAQESSFPYNAESPDPQTQSITTSPSDVTEQITPPLRRSPKISASGRECRD